MQALYKPCLGETTMMHICKFTIANFLNVPYCEQSCLREKILVPGCNTLAYRKGKKSTEIKNFVQNWLSNADMVKIILFLDRAEPRSWL